MATLSNSKLFSSSKMDSRIKSANIQKSEMWLGYFAGPCLVYMFYHAVAGTYLTQFYTDVLGIGGIFLTMMPVFSKIFDAITNIVMGRIIDRTRTRQGKARPWIAMSGVMMAVAGFLLYAIPRASYSVQIVWIIVSYNLFFAFAFTIYNMSHALMVPLSTRNTKQRDSLAMLTSAGISMIPGLLVTIIMPVIVRAVGVGNAAQGRWVTFMSIISILAIPGTLVEYYFTKERVTEESVNEDGVSTMEVVPLGQQIKACLTDKYWLIIMGFNLVYNVFNFAQTNISLYYANWVLADSVSAGTNLQLLMNAIGQAPLGFGIFLLWPLVHKFGKRRVMAVGYAISGLCCLGILFNSSPDKFAIVMALLFVRSLGSICTYAIAAQLAESLDHIEYVNGFRADGFSASVYAIIVTVSAGVVQSIILGGIHSFGYIQPQNVEQVIQQPSAVKTFFILCYVGIPLIGYVIGMLLQIFYDVEDKMPQIQAEMIERRKAEAAERGEVYISMEEKAAMEQAEQERISEEKRIEELKAKCAKKGLSFEEEEAKHQAKLSEKKAKEEAKAAKKAAKKSNKMKE